MKNILIQLSCLLSAFILGTTALANNPVILLLLLIFGIFSSFSLIKTLYVRNIRCGTFDQLARGNLPEYIFCGTLLGVTKLKFYGEYEIRSMLYYENVIDFPKDVRLRCGTYFKITKDGEIIITGRE